MLQSCDSQVTSGLISLPLFLCLFMAYLHINFQTWLFQNHHKSALHSGRSLDCRAATAHWIFIALNGSTVFIIRTLRLHPPLRKYGIGHTSLFNHLASGGAGEHLASVEETLRWNCMMLEDARASHNSASWVLFSERASWLAQMMTCSDDDSLRWWLIEMLYLGLAP